MTHHTSLVLVQERSWEQAARGDIAGSIDRLGVLDGALCSEPFELNHALIALIIGQQHLRASCAPTENGHREARLRDVGRPVAAASAAAVFRRTAQLCQLRCRFSDSPFYVPCTSLRAQAGAPSTEAAYAAPNWHTPRPGRCEFVASSFYPSAGACAVDACTPCTPDAADGICTSRMGPTYPHTPCMTSVGSATSSASMLSMHAADHSIPSGATSALARSAVHPALPERRVQRGELETPGLHAL